MPKRTLLTIAALPVAVAVLTAGCASQTLSSTGSTEAPSGPDLSAVTFVDETGVAAVEVDAVDNTYKEQYLEISAGTAVTFRNDGRNDHNVLPAAGGFTAIEADQFEPGTEQTITFATPGDYPYYCSLHGNTTKGMVGAIRVT